MGTKRERLTTGISRAYVTIPSSASISTVTARGRCCARDMCPVPRTGRRCWSRWWRGIGIVGCVEYLRADAAFARPEVYQYLEQEGFCYGIRLPANQVLQREIDHLLTRPVGRPPRHPIISYHDFRYQAGSWERPRRVVAKVEWHQGELFPRVGFVVTNMRAQPQRVVRFYNGRGTAEGWIKEGKYALHWTRLSCHRFRANQVRLALFVLAYNLGNFLRRLALPRSVRHWSLRSLQAKLIKIGAKVVTHSRRIIFQMAEVAVPRMLFEAILKRIGATGQKRKWLQRPGGSVSSGGGRMA